MKRITILIGLSAMLVVPACGSDGNDGPLGDVESIVFIQRQARMGGMGDIFQYQSYVPGAKLLKLTPPTADGTLTELCCNDVPGMEQADIIAFDISYDAKTIVFSARPTSDQRYGLFVLRVETGEIEQLPTDPMHDYVYPTIMSNNRVQFATNAVVEAGAPQFRDEYNRGVTLQMGSIGLDGNDPILCARNLSHRITSTQVADGTLIITQWDHLENMNAGQLIRMNPDCTVVREAFGKEGTGVTNSYYKAVEASPGRLIAIASSRDMTFQSGAILDIRLGEAYVAENGEIWADKNMKEANASTRILTANVPLMDELSSPNVGRYYSAYPLNANEYPDLLVSWADGFVQSDANAAAGVPPDFGIYLYDSERGVRRPIYDAEGTWEISPLPLIARTAPPVIAPSAPNQFSDDAVLLGALDVYNSSIQDFEPGSIYGVRVIEGFSVEEGIPDDFGLTEAEGAAVLGVAPVHPDGSWAALIPANIPVHQQVIDHYALSIRSEPIWISGNAGESMFCGGCHEDRAATTVIQPGITDAIAVGPVDLLSAVSRDDRNSIALGQVVGVPWDGALQSMFDANCISCHNGVAGPANPSFTITDDDTGESQTFVFNLTGDEVNYGLGDVMLSGYSASHLSMMGPDLMELEEEGINFTITGDFAVYMNPSDARGSLAIQLLNPPIQYPTVDMNNRVFATTGNMHEGLLTAQEYMLLILAADNGGQFYSRENAPGGVYGQ